MKKYFFFLLVFLFNFYSHADSFCISKRKDNTTYFYADAVHKIVCLADDFKIINDLDVTTLFWAVIPLPQNWFGEAQANLDDQMNDLDFFYVSELSPIPFDNGMSGSDISPIQIFENRANIKKRSYCVVGKYKLKKTGLNSDVERYQYVSIHCDNEHNLLKPLYAESVTKKEYHDYLLSLGYGLAFDSEDSNNKDLEIKHFWDFEVFVK